MEPAIENRMPYWCHSRSGKRVDIPSHIETVDVFVSSCNSEGSWSKKRVLRVSPTSLNHLRVAHDSVELTNTWWI
jgi:hypothetical protein